MAHSAKRQKSDHGHAVAMEVDSDEQSSNSKQRKLPSTSSPAPSLTMNGHKDNIAQQRAEFKQQLERFTDVCRLLRENAKTMFELKQKGRPQSEIDTVQTKSFMLFLELKQLNRVLTLKHEASKSSVQAVRVTCSARIESCVFVCRPRRTWMR